LDYGEFALSFFVPFRRRVLRASGFYARCPSRASVAMRCRGLLRGMALVRGLSIALIAVGAMPAAAQSGGNGGCFGACGGGGGVAGGTMKKGSLTGAVSSTGGTMFGISGAATLTTTAGITTFTGANTYSGATAINGGSLVGGAANVFSMASATSVGSGGTLDLGGFAQTVNAVSLAVPSHQHLSYNVRLGFCGRSFAVRSQVWLTEDLTSADHLRMQPTTASRLVMGEQPADIAGTGRRGIF
jgi:autotransporter-associated beta strand protein